MVFGAELVTNTTRQLTCEVCYTCGRITSDWAECVSGEHRICEDCIGGHDEYGNVICVACVDGMRSRFGW